MEELPFAVVKHLFFTQQFAKRVILLDLGLMVQSILPYMGLMPLREMLSRYGVRADRMRRSLRNGRRSGGVSQCVFDSEAPLLKIKKGSGDHSRDVGGTAIPVCVV